MLGDNTLALALWRPADIDVAAGPYVEWPEFARTVIQDKAELALMAAAREYPGQDVLLIQTNLPLPENFIARMQATLRQHEDVDVLSLADDKGPLVFDAQTVIAVDFWSRHASLWRALVITETFGTKARSVKQLSLAALNNIDVAPYFSDSNKEAPLIDSSKPVVLHVLHSWGGGVDHFAKDLQTGDRQRRHLFLKSHSHDSLPPYGKELSLYESLDKAPIATWILSEPIMDTDAHSEEVGNILASVIEKWAVGAVIVSSLIGHSLDVLETGLPTALAVHDVYPFWPLLHDANIDNYSTEYLDRALYDQPGTNIFIEHGSQYWVAVRDALTTIIRQKKVLCIAPSQFAKDRICNIDPVLNDAHWQVIPHGIDMPVMNIKADPKQPHEKLKVLVPGHINGGKGEDLLNALIPHLPDTIELVLLGSGHLSNKFSSEHVKTIADYQRDQLCQWVSELQPDIALLASTVPETYGYVLSEMLQLGIPVVCSNMGAYAERGQYLPGVTLVQPNMESFLQALIRFHDNPELLAEQKQKLPYVFPGLVQMANAWVAALPANPPQWHYEFTDDPAIDNEITMKLQITHLAQLMKAMNAATEKNTQSNADAESSMQKQKKNIESILDAVNSQSQQLAAMLVRQTDLEASLSNKSNKMSVLTTQLEVFGNALQEQATQMERLEKSFREAEASLQSEHELKFADISETVIRDKDLQQAQSAELLEKIAGLQEQLATMQAKRGWRFLSFFK